MLTVADFGSIYSSLQNIIKPYPLVFIEKDDVMSHTSSSLKSQREIEYTRYICSLVFSITALLNPIYSFSAYNIKSILSSKICWVASQHYDNIL